MGKVPRCTIPEIELYDTVLYGMVYILLYYTVLVGRHYTVSIALPGSILDNAQSRELRSYLAGQVSVHYFS